MGRKLTYDFVKEQFEKEGYTLLAKEYLSFKNQKLKYICPKGHKHEITFNNWCAGNRCKFCSIERRKIILKKNFNDIKIAFENDGYVLLEKDYTNGRTKMNYMCPKGHKHNITWNSWTGGNRCPSCSVKARHELEFIKSLFKKEGYTLLSKSYINNKNKLYYMCPNGHKHRIRFYDWKNGHRCPQCAGLAKPTFKDVENSFKAEGYTLLSENYKNNNTKLKYKCLLGHEHSIGWGNWKNGHRCPTCKGIDASIRLMGEGNPCWKGGLNTQPYCTVWRDKEYKNDIKSRDGYKCLNPHCSKKDNRLHIHHIDYAKKNCRPNNLITLCGSCNTKANIDREWHTSWYQAILKNRYNI